ncbi:MAG: DUF899 family protein [Pseudomonadota bacterium]
MTQQTQDLQEQITELEQKLYGMTLELAELRRQVPRHQGEVVPEYEFATCAGSTTLLDLFGDKDLLMVIHNMGQACRYCTLWGDGFNGFLPHLESAMSVVLVSKDDPQTQREFANHRGWRFQLASHGGGAYIQEEATMPGQSNMPGVVVYERDGQTVRRRDSAVFGPGDLYCSAWNLLALAGLTEAEWMPQFNYWRRPEQLEDGGENIID